MMVQELILQTQLHDLHCIKHNQADLINMYKCKGKRKKKKQQAICQLMLTVPDTVWGSVRGSGGPRGG